MGNTRAEEYRLRAEELRVAAETMKDQDTRKQLITAAMAYDKMASSLDEKSALKNSKNNPPE
jgi:hypothetical protein